MIFQKQTQYKNVYDKVFKLFMENAKKRKPNSPESNYSHIFLAVNNYDQKEEPYYCASELNNNFPELVEELIWQHLFDILPDDRDLTDDEICAHYNWVINKVSRIAAEKRLETTKELRKDE